LKELITGAKTIQRVRNETEQPTKTQASVLFSDTKRRVRRDVSHDCSRRATGPCKVCSRIAEMYESEIS